MRKYTNAIVMCMFIVTAILCTQNESYAGTVNQEFPLASSLSGTQRWPMVAYANGVYLVVWQEGFDSWGSNIRIRAEQISDSGDVVDSGGFLLSDVSDVQEMPSVATDGNQFFVVWQDFRNGKDYDTYGTRVSTDGRVLDPGGILIGKGVGNQSYPTVAFDGTNFVVSWMDNRVMEQSYAIRAARVSTGGVVLDGAGVEIAGDTLTALNKLITDSWQGLPVRAYPKISCTSNECVIGWSQQTAIGTSDGHQQTPKIAVIHTSPTITVTKTMSLARNDAVFASAVSGSPVSAGARFFAAAQNANKNMFMYSGAQGTQNVQFTVAGIPYTTGSTDTTAQSIPIRLCADGWNLGNGIAPYGAGFISYLAEGATLTQAPLVQGAFQSAYTLKRSVVDASNKTTTTTVFPSNLTYRGYPQVSVGASHGLVVYEKDGGVAAMLFD